MALPKPPKAPPHALPKGREFLLSVFEVVVWRSFSLEKVGMGLPCWMVRNPGNSVGVAAACRGTLRVLPTIYCSCEDDEIKTATRVILIIMQGITPMG